jgi:hypothetical protein
MLLPAAIVLVFGLGGVESARADGNPDQGWTRVDQVIDLNFIEINSCNGSEAVSLVGQFSATTRTKVQPNGTLSVREALSASATGVGPTSGADYTFSDSQISKVDGLGTLPFDQHFNRIVKLIGDGVPDETLHYDVHFSIAANGTVKHDLGKFNAICGP